MTDSNTRNLLTTLRAMRRHVVQEMAALNAAEGNPGGGSITLAANLQQAIAAVEAEAGDAE